MPPALEILNLGDYGNKNKFTGGIPAEWGSLTNLKELKLAKCGRDGACRVCSGQHRRLVDERNASTGPLPKTMPSALEILIMNRNKFTGGIPAEWGSLTNLKELKLAACGLDGACRVCSVQQNKVERQRECRQAVPIPSKSSQSDLRAFLAGAVPATIGNLTNLQTLYLYDNELSGAFVGPDIRKAE